MKITIWGCRGSLTIPGPATVRYGGNTTCLEIRTADHQVIVVDAGSGLRNLGKALLAENKITDIFLLFTHSHWDHLVGFPFFGPAYLERYTLTLCGGPKTQQSLRQYLTHQMEAPYFPVGFELLKARFDFGCECPKTGNIGSVAVYPVALSHPNEGYGYKLVENGRSFVFLTDNELGFRHPGGLSRAQYVDFCRGADLLFHDAQYTDEEYKRTRGWGHSNMADATDLAIEAQVKRFALFHHDLDRSDDDLDRQIENCRKRIRQAGSAVECFGAAEGMVLEL
jgi:phosphoribosyl 1,2-cyclic phosphodiesterase